MPLDAALPPSLRAILDDFRRRLANLERSPRLTSASIRGGLLRILDDAGKAVMLLGKVGDRTVFQAIRANGSTVLWMGRTEAGDEFFSVVDKGSRIVISDDAISGGLATPWIPVYPSPAGPVGQSGYIYQETGDPNPRGLYQVTFQQQHPRLYIAGQVWSEAGTNWLLELVDENDGNRVIASQSGSGQGTFTWTVDFAAMGGASKLQTMRYLLLRISRTAGSGRTGGRLVWAYGIQS